MNANLPYGANVTLFAVRTICINHFETAKKWPITGHNYMEEVFAIRSRDVRTLDSVSWR